jgi:hypothetical protein
MKALLPKKIVKPKKIAIRCYDYLDLDKYIYEKYNVLLSRAFLSWFIENYDLREGSNLVSLMIELYADDIPEDIKLILSYFEEFADGSFVYMIVNIDNG